MAAIGRSPRVLTPAILVPALLGGVFAIPGSASTEPARQPALQQQILDLTNAARADAGCPALRISPTLNRAATEHSTDMASNRFFEHLGSDGSRPGHRAQEAGYPSGNVGENIAAGNVTAYDTFAQWMTSPGHRANILDCAYTELGVGYAERESSVYHYYWTQNFGMPGSR